MDPCLSLCLLSIHHEVEELGQLSLAAQTTTRLRLGTGVTNPFTRDVAVTATAFATSAGSSM